jgi:predicted acyltransferase
VFLLFRTNRTALLGCVVLMMCLYPANKQGMFGSLWMAKHINIGVALGSRAAIAGTGLLLGAMLSSPGGNTAGSRARFTLLLTAGCAAAAWLLGGLYGVSKETATPSWALWGCAVTAGLWLVFYFVVDVHPVGVIARPLTLAGQNVLLAYLISEMVPALLGVLGLTQAYEGLAQPALSHAVIRSSGCALVVLSAAVGLNRIGFRVRL